MTSYRAPCGPRFLVFESDGALVQPISHLHVGDKLAVFQGLTKLGVVDLPAVNGPLVLAEEVRNLGIGGAGGKGALMSPRTTQGTQRQLVALLTGQHLKFAVFQGPEQLVDMPFYNDDEFSIIYRQEVEKAGTGSKPEEKKKGWFGRR